MPSEPGGGIGGRDPSAVVLSLSRSTTSAQDDKAGWISADWSWIVADSPHQTRYF